MDQHRRRTWSPQRQFRFGLVDPSRRTSASWAGAGISPHHVSGHTPSCHVRFHKLSSSVTSVRLRLSLAYGYIVGCKEHRTSAAHRKRRSCSVLFTGHPFDEHGLRVPRCPFFPRQLTHITTAVFEKDVSRVVRGGCQILKHLHLTSFAYGLRTERDQTYIFVWGDENVCVFNSFCFFGGEVERGRKPYGLKSPP